MSKGLQIDEALDFQERQTKVQYVGWAVVALALLGALLGVFGEGPLSHARMTADDGSLTVDFDRITRHGAPSSLTFTVAPAAFEEGQARVSLSTEFLQRVLVEHVTPEPESVESAPEHTVFVFAAASADQPVVATFDIRHSANWVAELEASVGDRPSHRIRQFVIP